VQEETACGTYDKPFFYEEEEGGEEEEDSAILRNFVMHVSFYYLS